MLPSSFFTSILSHTFRPALLLLACAPLLGSTSLAQDSKLLTNVKFDAGSSYINTLDELVDPYMIFGVSSSFEFSGLEAWTFSAGLGLTQPTTEYVTDTSYYGVTDVEVAARGSNSILLSPEQGSLTPAYKLTLPLSERSRLSSLISSFSAELSWSQKLNKYFQMRASGSTILSTYEYETADVFGYKKNSPFGVVYAVGLGVTPIEAVNLSIGYSRYERSDYDGYWNSTQTFTSSVATNFGKHVALSLGYSWSDRYYSNDPVFDLGKTSVSLGLSISY